MSPSLGEAGSRFNSSYSSPREARSEFERRRKYCWQCQHQAQLYGVSCLDDGHLSELGQHAEALINAAINDDLNALRREIWRGTPIDICMPYNGGTALDWAAKHNNLNALRFLVEEAHAPVQTHNGVLVEAAGAGHLAIAEYLVDGLHMHIDSAGCNGCSALLAAVAMDRPTMVQFLLDRGASPGAQAVGRHGNIRAGMTTLTMAAAMGSHTIVQQLLAAAAPVDLCDASAKNDHQNETALLIAARDSHLEIVHSLLSARADINCADSDGWTALHNATYVAVSRKPEENDFERRLLTMEALMQHGADTDAKTFKTCGSKRNRVLAGSTALDIVNNPRMQQNSWQAEVLSKFERVVFQLEIEELETEESKHLTNVVVARRLSGSVAARVGVNLQSDDLEALHRRIKKESGVACSLQQFVFSTCVLEHMPVHTKLIECLK